MSHKVPAKSSVADTVALDSQQLKVQDDPIYDNVDDIQGQMFMVSSNPAYGTTTEHSRQPVPQDDHTSIHCAVDSSQQVEVATSGSPAYGTSIQQVEVATSANPAYGTSIQAAASAC